jgi:LuxR family maltose regulon positive regulatory protein
MLARLERTQGRVERALDTLQKVDCIAEQVNIDPWITCWADECRLKLHQATGNLQAVELWVQTSGLGAEDELDYHRDLHHTNLARAFFAQGVAQDGKVTMGTTLDLLERLLLAAEKAGWVHKTIQIAILQALALQAAGDTDRALAALERALVLAEPGSYVRIFCDEGAPMADLLRHAAERGIHSSYASRLLSTFGDRFTAQTPEVKTAPPPLFEPLSERETEVLRLVAAGLTNRQIGDQLFISAGTVKAHTSNIYGKLGVRSRTQAVARAQALNLL